MKGQVLIIQFILFFLIGMSVFLILGNFFRLSSDSFRSEIISSGVQMTSSYASAAVIKMVDGCKGCDYVAIKIKTQNRTAGYPIQLELSGKGINASVPILQNKYFLSSIHLLNTTLQIISGRAFSERPITLTFNRTQNNLGVS